jgi:hypothetical protein
VWREETEGGRGVPASRAIHRVCPHTRGGRGKVQWGREEESRSSRSRGEIEVGSQYGPKRTRRCSWEVSDHDWTGCINHGADDVCTGRRLGLGLDLLHGDRSPRDEALGMGKQDQVGDSDSQDRLDRHVPSRIRE